MEYDRAFEKCLHDHKNKTFTLYQNFEQCTCIFSPFFLLSLPASLFKFCIYCHLIENQEKIQASVIFSTFTSRVDEVKGKTWVPVFKYEKLGKSYKVFINKR